MAKLTFNSSPGPSLGVELELGLVDAQSFALTSAIERVLEALPEHARSHVKPEIMQSVIEINTDVCQTAEEAEQDLRGKLIEVERACDKTGLRLWWGGTHPFSLWKDQQVTENERYKLLIQLLQETARQLTTLGLHVHVGVDSGDKAIMICDRIMQYLPMLLAVSVNSPFWEGRATGLQSHRAMVMQNLPTAGLPTVMRNWSEYTWLINHLVATGFIYTIREIWWDVRPHHNFGTVEVRMCDMPGNLSDVVGLAALIQALVKALSDDIDEGAYQLDYHPMIVRQNKWRATRFGNQALLVDTQSFESRSVAQVVERLIARLRPAAASLGSEAYLDRVAALAAGPSWASRQLQIFEETGDLKEVVRRLSAQSRVSPAT